MNTKFAIQIVSLFLLLPLFLSEIKAAGPAKIDLESLTIYEIGASHTPGEDKSGGTQKCTVGGGNLDGTCTVAAPCTCDATMQPDYYYRLEFQIGNDGATADAMWGYYSGLANLAASVDTANDIWVTDGGADETCSQSTWADNTLTWLEGDASCSLDLAGAEVGQLKFILKAGASPATTSGGTLFSEEGAGAGNLTGYSEITAVPSFSPVVSVVVKDGGIAYGTIATGACSTTTSDTQYAINNGNVTEDFNIKSADSTNWDIATSTPDVEIYTHQFTTTTGSYWQFLDNEYVTLETGVTASGTSTIDTFISLPSTTTNFTEQTMTITIQAVQQ